MLINSKYLEKVLWMFQVYTEDQQLSIIVQKVIINNDELSKNCYS